MLALLIELALRSLVLGGAVWAGLKIMRARNPHVHMTAWTLVLIASLSMPVLSNYIKVTLPANPLSLQTLQFVRLAPTLARVPISSLPMTTPLPEAPTAIEPVRSTMLKEINWWSVATAVYALVTSALLLRLLVGILLTWRLARTARPIGAFCAFGSRVRISDVVGTPVTFGTTILLPPEYRRWDLMKRQAVLSHEGSHVAHGDFYVLFLAALNRAVFWFSPFSWWQLTRLAELAEIISDDAALEVLEDRLTYADILLDLAQNVQRAPAGIAMARVCTVRKRIERLLGPTTSPEQLDWIKRVWIGTAVASLAVMSAGTIAYSTSPPQTDAPNAPTQRVDAAKGNAVKDLAARRITAAPERFRDQTPAPGGKEAVLRGIQDVQMGTPNYDRMSAQLAAKVRRQASQLRDTFTALGSAESIFFRGVGPGGYDIYGVKFANGFGEFRIQLGVDGTTEDVIFRPDGDDTPGGVVACSEEPGLKSTPGTAPIKLLLHNSSGGEVYLFSLDFDGKRVPHGSVGDDRTLPIFTNVNRPWLIADAQGHCIEIVMPGQRTRFVTLDNPQRGRPVTSRSTPVTGSEETLRQYIDGLGRGEPTYSQMTTEVAAETRKQLLLNQAILEKLGPLRAMSFRGVSALGSDIYIGHFANGSAEWRISLVKDGKIGRIALGPQY